MGSACDLDLIQEDHLGEKPLFITDNPDNNP
jgi:hypothetical protein